MKRLAFAILLFIIFVIAHHGMIYINEWVHGFVAWLGGYKSSPFDIYYGVQWFTLWDIYEAIDYPKIHFEGKAYIVAWIAIAPTVLQMILFPIGLKVLSFSKVQKNRWLFAFLYFFNLNLLGEIYAYIPIRTFGKMEDMFNFLNATGFSPWVIAIPGTLYVIWGMYQILTKQLPQAYSSLKITTESGRFTFKLATLVIFFFYFGAAGLVKPDAISRVLSLTSWAVLLLIIIILCIQRMKKNQ